MDRSDLDDFNDARLEEQASLFGSDVLFRGQSLRVVTGGASTTRAFNLQGGKVIQYSGTVRIPMFSLVTAPEVDERIIISGLTLVITGVNPTQGAEWVCTLGRPGE